MPRKKRSSLSLERAEKRLAAMQSLGDSLDLGNGLTLARFSEHVNELRSLIFEYNAALSNLDRVANDVEASERALNDLSELMLLGVATTYGKYSNEYEMAGGVRKNERKRRRLKPAEAAEA